MGPYRAEKPIVVDKAVDSQTTSEDGATLSPHVAPIDGATEKRLVRKLDVHVIPIIAFLYMCSFLDRINIGNARIQGLERDLNMKGHDFNVALLIFFIPYILLEVPSNLLIRKLNPSTWLSSLMVLWGIATVAQGVTKSFAGLVVCRFLLGAFEAGFFPGVLYLISSYYRRFELQLRLSYILSATILAGAFGGLLAYALAKMEGVGGYNGWRWIFIIEGLATIVFGVAAKFLIADWPEDAKFLSAHERQLVVQRIRYDTADVQMDRFDAKARHRTFGDWKIYMGILMYFGIANTGYSTSFFIPTILKQLGWTSVRAQVMSIPIYIVSAICCLLGSFTSDRVKHRFGFIIFGISMATIGYIVLLAQEAVSVPGRYAAVYVAMTGGYIAQPVMLVWVTNNMGGHYKRSVNAAMQIGFGNLGGIVASNIYITNQAPKFPVGFGVTIGLLWLAAAAAIALFVGLKLENKKRDRGDRNIRYDLPADELNNLGDDHPRFRFVY